MVLMMKPRVGLTVLTSSPMIFFTMVVFPALSSPLDHAVSSVQSWVGNEKRVTHSIRIRSSLSLSRAFRKIDSIFSVSGSAMFVRGQGQLWFLPVWICVRLLHPVGQSGGCCSWSGAVRLSFLKRWAGEKQNTNHPLDGFLSARDHPLHDHYGPDCLVVNIVVNKHCGFVQTTPRYNGPTAHL